MASNMEAILMGGDDSDSDSDDNSTGVVEVAAGTVPTSAAAAILNSNPPIAAPIPAPMPAPAPAPIQRTQPVVVSRAPVPTSVAPSSRPMTSSTQPPPVSRVNPMQGVTSMNRGHVNVNVHNSISSHPSASKPSNPLQRSVVSSVNNPVAGVRVGSMSANPQTTSVSAHQAQQNKLKSLYSARSAVPPVSAHPTAPQHQPRQTYQPVVSSKPPSSVPTISHDAFEPTPLDVIKAKTKTASTSVSVSSQQRGNHPMQHMMSHPPVPPVQRNPQHSRQHPFGAGTTTSTPTSRPRTSPAPSSSQQQQQQRQHPPPSQQPSASSHEQKSRKERFLMFTRVLMKYLEQKDRSMHAKAKEVIRQCAKKNKEGDPNYVSLSASMQSHLKKLVGENYWKKAEEYLRQYLYGQYSKDGMAGKDAKKKAEEVAKSAAEPLPANTPTYPPPPTRQTSKSQPATSSGWQGTQQQPSSINAPTSHVQAHAVKAAQKKKRQEATKKRKAEAAAAAAAAAAQASAAALASQSQSQSTITQPPKTTGGQTNTTGTTSATVGKTTKGKKPSSASRKNSLTTAAATSASTKITQVHEPKEYEELMEMLDHVVDYDVSSCAKILGNGSSSKQKSDLNISEEQKKLLYHDFGMPGGPRKGLYGGTKIKDENISHGSSSTIPSSSKIPPYLKGWGTRNIVSSRSAWAKLRLAEDEAQGLSEISLPLVKSSNNAPHTSVIPVTSGSSVGSNQATLYKSGAGTETETDPHARFSWFNEEKAEQDEALTLISEATQQYIKTILEGAMNTASKRLNWDGIRLWHQQHTDIDVVTKEVETNGVSLPKNSTRGPPLCIRLGCDVKRQYAMVQGNAAKTSQRLEEALARKSEYKTLDAKTIYEATSMTELSKMPQISSAAKKAEYNAKRSFEIYGGKESGDPPLGRVPKQAKILLKDFKACLSDSSFAMSKNRVSTSAFV